MPRSLTFSDGILESPIQQNVEEQQAALRGHVADNFSADPQVYSVLAQLLALPLAEAEAELIKELKGEEFRARFFAIVEDELLALAEQQPIVLVIDDLHWADESSIDLLASVLPLVKRTRFTCISVSRSRQKPVSLWSKLASFWRSVGTIWWKCRYNHCQSTKAEP